MHARSPAPWTVPLSTRTPSPNENHVEAASILQRHFRIRQSIRSIKSLTADLNTLRRNFTYPSTISFQNLGDAGMPKLAFNSTNYDLHAYIEELDKLVNWMARRAGTIRRCVQDGEE
ncbi:hypothetical protein AN958_01918 [Leucoagaricus sp. SymC.cos]|nr:hypothetical protein AN958_01918 [Leucoagaricus sp. SymC.cos]